MCVYKGYKGVCGVCVHVRVCVVYIVHSPNVQLRECLYMCVHGLDIDSVYLLINFIGLDECLLWGFLS